MSSIPSDGDPLHEKVASQVGVPGRTDDDEQMVYALLAAATARGMRSETDPAAILEPSGPSTAKLDAAHDGSTPLACLEEPHPPIMTESAVADTEMGLPDEYLRSIESASRRMSETLATAEQQLGAIASAFDVAASELSGGTQGTLSTPPVESTPTGAGPTPARARSSAPETTASIRSRLYQARTSLNWALDELLMIVEEIEEARAVGGV
ncbi:MAG: hypothetical protein HY718_05430 [Planctomycetes bacterium]|nr:hypothetical protein [Planctomycetota bacterium]